jgi:hypothetical protein
MQHAALKASNARSVPKRSKIVTGLLRVGADRKRKPSSLPTMRETETSPVIEAVINRANTIYQKCTSEQWRERAVACGRVGAIRRAKQYTGTTSMPNALEPTAGRPGDILRRNRAHTIPRAHVAAAGAAHACSNWGSGPQAAHNGAGKGVARAQAPREQPPRARHKSFRGRYCAKMRLVPCHAPACSRLRGAGVLGDSSVPACWS